MNLSTIETKIAPTDGVGAMVTRGETASSILAAQLKAKTEARFIMAMKRPRNIESVRVKLLEACERPGFAGSATEKVYGAAWWSMPVGKQNIEGFSIRFAEECMRAMSNMDASSTIIYDDDDKRIILVEVLDLECNLSIPTTIVVEKTIERKFLKKGEVAISSRQNSYGDTVYLRQATDDEVMQKQNSLISKAMRNGILRLVPGDIQNECRQKIQKIRMGEIVEDPNAAKRKIIDAFTKIGVGPDDLESLLEHKMSQCSPEEIRMLRDTYSAIKNGETTFKDELNQRKIESGDIPEPENKLDAITKENNVKNGKQG